MRVLDLGCGDRQRGRREFPEAEIVGLDLQAGWNADRDSIPNAVWDVIFVHHLLEHLWDVDLFLERCKRAMLPGHTKLIIGMPNLASWVNRLVFLGGYLPRCYEVSTRYNVGKPFGWHQDGLGGHRRVFTVRAFCQLLALHGFTILRLRGEPSTAPCWRPIHWLDGWLTRLSPSLASAFRVEVIR